MSKYCWTTLLATDNYVWGVIGLHYSLQRVETDYPLIVIATDNLSQETFNLLEKVGIQYKIFPYKEFIMQEDTYTHYSCTINKFYAWTFTEYEKVGFIDADVLINLNIDFFFRFPAFCSCQYYYPKINGVNRVQGVYSFIFILNPDESFAERIFEEFKNCLDDEQVLDYFFFANSDYLNHWLPNDISLFFHDLNRDKYWDRYELYHIEKVKYFVRKQLYYYILDRINYSSKYVGLDVGVIYDDDLRAEQNKELLDQLTRN